MQQGSKHTCSRTTPATRGLTNPEYAEYSTRLTRLRKDSKSMLTLENQGTGIQESKKNLAEKLTK
jgi:hypothetical protein